MADTSLTVEQARNQLIKATEQLSLLPNLLYRAASGDSSLSASELTGAESLAADIIRELRTVAEALESNSS